MRRRPRIIISGIAASGLLLGPAAVAASAANDGARIPVSAEAPSTVTVALGAHHAGATPLAAKRYQNCKALQKRYPHGVGMPSAVDRTSGKAVTNFKRSSALYKANTHLDRDKDRIACEKR